MITLTKLHSVQCWITKVKQGNKSKIIRQIFCWNITRNLAKPRVCIKRRDVSDRTRLFKSGRIKELSSELSSLIQRTCTSSCRPRWSRSLSRGSAVARLLRLWVRISPGAWMSVSCECCVVSGRGLCVELITLPEECYGVWCVWMWSWILEVVLANQELSCRGKKNICSSR
jgi:hypothetical protein